MTRTSRRAIGWVTGMGEGRNRLRLIRPVSFGNNILGSPTDRSPPFHGQLVEDWFLKKIFGAVVPLLHKEGLGEVAVVCLTSPNPSLERRGTRAEHGLKRARVTQVCYCLSFAFLLLASAAHAQLEPVIGQSNGDGHACSLAKISPFGMAWSGADLIIADKANHRVRKCAAGILSTIAGTGQPGYSGDGGVATAAKLNNPTDVVTLGGSIYLTDTANHCVRRIDPAGTITSVSCAFNWPTGLAVTSTGKLLVADENGHRVYRLATDGTLTLVAGTGMSGSSGDNGPAIAAKLSSPCDVVEDPLGNVLIADKSNCRVRRVDLAGNISTIAGNGVCKWTTDGVPATSTGVDLPVALALDGPFLYVAEYRSRVRRVDLVTGIITSQITPAVLARSVGPSGLALSPDGLWLYLADFAAGDVRRAAVGASTPTLTPVLTLTPTLTPTDTATRAPPTETPTDTETATATPTQTATSSATHTATSSPSSTPTRTPGVTYAGRVLYFAGARPVPGVTVTLTCSGGWMSAVTGADGAYNISTIPPGPCSLSASKLGGWGVAISNQDVAIASGASVGKRALTDYETLACDVNGNGVVRSQDVALISQFVNGKLARFPVAVASGSDWGFVASGWDFVAVLFGDCSGNWTN